MIDNYKAAVMLKIRFEMANGSVTLEDVWGYNDAAVSKIYKDLKGKMDEFSGDSFLNEVAKPDKALEVAFELIKDLIVTRRELKDAKATDAKVMAEIAELTDVKRVVDRREIEALTPSQLDKKLAKLKAKL